MPHQCVLTVILSCLSCYSSDRIRKKIPLPLSLSLSDALARFSVVYLVEMTMYPLGSV